MLPSVSEGSDQTTLLGFVALARLFVAIEDDFILSWSRKSLSAGGSQVARLLEPDRFSRVSPISSIICETQRVDITLTQCWLRTLVCQLQGRLGISPGSTTKRCVTESAKSLLACFNDFSRESLESHGIGLVRRHFCCAIYNSSILSRATKQSTLALKILTGSH